MGTCGGKIEDKDVRTKSIVQTKDKNLPLWFADNFCVMQQIAIHRRDDKDIYILYGYYVIYDKSKEPPQMNKAYSIGTFDPKTSKVIFEKCCLCKSNIYSYDSADIKSKIYSNIYCCEYCLSKIYDDQYYFHYITKICEKLDTHSKKKFDKFTLRDQLAGKDIDISQFYQEIDQMIGLIDKYLKWYPGEVTFNPMMNGETFDVVVSVTSTCLYCRNPTASTIFSVPYTELTNVYNKICQLPHNHSQCITKLHEAIKLNRNMKNIEKK